MRGFHANFDRSVYYDTELVLLGNDARLAIINAVRRICSVGVLRHIIIRKRTLSCASKCRLPFDIAVY